MRKGGGGHERDISMMLEGRGPIIRSLSGRPNIHAGTVASSSLRVV